MTEMDNFCKSLYIVFFLLFCIFFPENSAKYTFKTEITINAASSVTTTR